MEKLVVYLPFTDVHKKILEDKVKGRLDIVYSTDPKDLKDANIVAGIPPLAELESNMNLKWIIGTWAGTDYFTTSPYFHPERVALSHMVGLYGVIVSEYLVSGVLSVMRNFPLMVKNAEKHIWDDQIENYTLEGKNVVVIGTGDIATNFAKRIKGFDCHIIGFSRSAKPAPYFDEIHKIDELDDFLKDADYVVVTIPGNTGGDHLFDEARLRKIKKGAIIANSGRGNIIDNVALAKLLTEGHLAGAAIDVFEIEPLPADHPIWDAPNALVTPHIAGVDFGTSRENEIKIAKKVAEIVETYLETGEMIDLYK